MGQIALPLGVNAGPQPPRILLGNANASIVAALDRAQTWPFHTAVLGGPARSGKSLLARWFEEEDRGEVIDDAHRAPEDMIFHRWNRAQQTGTPLLLVDASGEEGGWRIALPDLASRIAAALHLTIAEPDDAMLGDLIALHAQRRGFALDRAAIAYLVPRCRRSHLGAETLVETIDRLSLERKHPPTLSVWRDALDEIAGGRQHTFDGQPRLL